LSWSRRVGGNKRSKAKRHRKPELGTVALSGKRGSKGIVREVLGILGNSRKREFCMNSRKASWGARSQPRSKKAVERKVTRKRRP